MDGRDKAIARIGQLRASIRAMEQEVTDLVESLGPVEYGKSAHGPWIMEVSPNKRFDAKTARDNLSAEDYKRIQMFTPNSTLAKALLGEGYEKCQKVYPNPKVSVYLPTDEE